MRYSKCNIYPTTYISNNVLYYIAKELGEMKFVIFEFEVLNGLGVNPSLSLYSSSYFIKHWDNMNPCTHVHKIRILCTYVHSK